MIEYVILILIVVIVFVSGVFVGFILLNSYSSRDKKLITEYNNKHLKLYIITIQWFQNYLKGKRIKDFLEERGYSKIAIYGISYIGETLIYELEDSKIEISYLVDNNRSYLSGKYKVYTSDSELETVDAIIVTPITYYEQIKEQLSSRVSFPIISFEDIVK